MKHYTSLRATTLSMTLIFFYACGMEHAIIQTQSQQMNQIQKDFSTLREAINKELKGDSKNQYFITQTIEKMRDAKILDEKYYYYDYVYNEKTKPYIIKQFFTHYPQQACPELQSIANTLNNVQDRQDFFTILSTITTDNETIKQHKNQITRIINNATEASQHKNRTFHLKDSTIKVIHEALDAICSNLNQENMSQKEPESTNKNTTKKATLLIKIKRQHNVLGDLLPREGLLYSVNHFTFFSNKIAEARDPKDENAMRLLSLYKQNLESEAIKAINEIVNRYPLISDQLSLIEERFHHNSLFFLKKTAEHNQNILNNHPELLPFSQQDTPEKQELSTEELPTLLLEPEIEPLNPNILSNKQSDISIKSTSKKQPGFVKKETFDAEPKKPESMFTQFITFAQNSINNALNKVYNGILWILTKIKWQ